MRVNQANNKNPQGHLAAQQGKRKINPQPPCSSIQHSGETKKKRWHRAGRTGTKAMATVRRNKANEKNARGQPLSLPCRPCGYFGESFPLPPPPTTSNHLQNYCCRRLSFTKYLELGYFCAPENKGTKGRFQGLCDVG